MNMRLDAGHIRLRLSRDESETLLRLNQLTITISWVTGDDLSVAFTLSADIAQVSVYAEALSVYVTLPRTAFLELCERVGHRDAALSWVAVSALGHSLQWSLEIDAFRSRLPRGQAEQSSAQNYLT
ncbi:MAG: hypothetical protein NTX25_13095 [Proteobacteria bacterium]|nr:hypothetical protein [Pseudomonadota bacterium]